MEASSRPDAPTSHRHPTSPGHGGSAVPLESATPAKEKSTPAPGVSIATTTAKPGHTPPKEAVPTIVTKPEGKKDTATTQPPSGMASPTPDLNHETAGTTREMALSPEHHVPSPASGINGTSFQAESKVSLQTGTLKTIIDAVLMLEKGSGRQAQIVMRKAVTIVCVFFLLQNNIESSSLKEPLLNELCRNVKSSFNRSRDDCTVLLASVADDPKKLAIIRVSVTSKCCV
ncbi:hypothetical protein JD844_028934 [Phrynosoma platyrhinos]|uniref:Uncharacterized protein n=1 Tax=Phrynosoma platyrhinos TaxID=52577 RepID=A0ABQ7SIN6_PHRPL|nr:hypothetical protein JD844_028934 [Phrynosoma platyrhinos]